MLFAAAVRGGNASELDKLEAAVHGPDGVRVARIHTIAPAPAAVEGQTGFAEFAIVLTESEAANGFWLKLQRVGNLCLDSSGPWQPSRTLLIDAVGFTD